MTTTAAELLANMFRTPRPTVPDDTPDFDQFVIDVMSGLVEDVPTSIDRLAVIGAVKRHEVTYFEKYFAPEIVPGQLVDDEEGRVADGV